MASVCRVDAAELLAYASEPGGPRIDRVARLRWIDSVSSLAGRQLPVPAGRHVMAMSGAHAAIAHGPGRHAFCAAE
jgi:hypothetical protein